MMVLDKVIVKSIRKEWKRILKKFGLGSKFNMILWEKSDTNLTEAERMLDEVVGVLNEFLSRIEKIEVQKKYWKEQLEKIINEAKELKEYYETFLEDDEDD